MSSARKFTDNYPKESDKQESSPSKEDIVLQKKEIEVYIRKIGEILKESEGQKKAAEILSQLINSK